MKREVKSGQYQIKVWTPQGMIMESNTRHNLDPIEFDRVIRGLIDRLQQMLSDEAVKV